jgi:hypothetical protein
MYTLTEIYPWSALIYDYYVFYHDYFLDLLSDSHPCPGKLDPFPGTLVQLVVDDRLASSGRVAVVVLVAFPSLEAEEDEVAGKTKRITFFTAVLLQSLHW